MFFFCTYLYRRKVFCMKENKRTIPVDSLPFCKGCENESLYLHTKRLYADNEEYERHHVVSCKFRNICMSLYERLTSQYESEEEWNETEEFEENDDYCFCSDTSWEDRQI